METIGKQEIWTFTDGSGSATTASCSTIRSGSGYKIRSYIDLATRVAELQFRNRDFVLLFRGQSADHLNQKRHTTLKPSLFRPKGTGNPPSELLIKRFWELRRAEEILIKSYEKANFVGLDRLKKHQIIRWSILQHYEICPTPLLDVTHSLRIAASFASNEKNDEAFVFVVGVPNLSGAITASNESGLQIVRLASVCPPAALRPHIQEGYLLGEYPEMTGFEQKELYQHFEIDFGRRLVAKFRFNPKTFWKSDAFPQVGPQALYPSSKADTLHKMAQEVKTKIALN